jgi:hypothetical protein
MTNEANQGQQSGGQQQKGNPSGQQQSGQKKPNESGEQGSQGNDELQVASRSKLLNSVVTLGKGRKTKSRTKESAHKHDLFPPPPEVRGPSYLSKKGHMYGT